MKILIKKGRILNPSDQTDKVGDILVEDGVIKEIKEKIECKEIPEKIIDAKGCYVMPGLIDLHVHLRDPGLTYKEDVVTGAKAGAKGGFPTILAMPNSLIPFEVTSASLRLLSLIKTIIG